VIIKFTTKILKLIILKNNFKKTEEDKK